MYEVFPDYYFEFKCIAHKCKHTCCAGWEIDIDKESYEKYKRDGVKHICECDELHFILTKNERCPYLNKDNLCDLIIEHGENYLCQICTDHPRFRNYWDNVTETGLGLCCEEAARLILTNKKSMELVSQQGDIMTVYESLPDDEKYLWNIRKELFERASNIDNSMEARLYEYLVFRHIPDALYDGMLSQRICFVDKCFDDITLKWNETNSIDEKIEVARAYSEDVEYDTDRIKDFLNSI